MIGKTIEAKPIDNRNGCKTPRLFHHITLHG